MFEWIQENGNVETAEMYRTFNCGIGMAVVVAASDADRALEILRESGETAWVIGELGEGERVVELS